MERHRSMQSSPGVVADAVERATGSPLAAKVHITTIADVNEAYALLEAHQLLWDPLIEDGTVPRLLHGDLEPAHILVSEGRLGGLIDFEFPASGDPAEELAGWDRAHGNVLPTAWLLEGYEAVAPPDSTFRLRLALHRVRISFAQLGRKNPLPALLDVVRAKLSRDVLEVRRQLLAGRTAGGLAKGLG
jgi:hypothetical protein